MLTMSHYSIPHVVYFKKHNPSAYFNNYYAYITTRQQLDAGSTKFEGQVAKWNCASLWYIIWP